MDKIEYKIISFHALPKHTVTGSRTVPVVVYTCYPSRAEIGGPGGQPQPPGNSKPAWIYKTKPLVKNKERAGSGFACLESPQPKAGRSSEFLVYKESSRTTRATQRNPVSKKKKRQNLTT